MLLSSGGWRYCEKKSISHFHHCKLKQCRVIEESENWILKKNSSLKTIFQAKDRCNWQKTKLCLKMSLLNTSSIQPETISTSVITSSKEQRPWMETNLIFYCAQINEAKKLKILVDLKNTVNEDSMPNKIFFKIMFLNNVFVHWNLNNIFQQQNLKWTVM